MIKTILYTVTYNDAKYVKDWLRYYDDIDLFLIIDLNSTDNTIDLLSEDPRVFSLIPGFTSSITALDFALKKAKDMTNKYPEDQWLFLSFGIDEVPEENLIQKIKEKYQESPFYQLSVRNQYKNSVIRCCTAEGQSDWTYIKNSYTLKGLSAPVVQTNFNFTQRKIDIESEIKKKISDFISGGTLNSEEIPFILEVLNFCKNKNSSLLYDTLFPKIITLYDLEKSRAFGVKTIFRLWTVYLLLFSIRALFYPEKEYFCSSALYQEMRNLYNDFKDPCFLFKRIPYNLARVISLKQDFLEEEKRECLDLLVKARSITSNTSIPSFYTDLSDDNLEIQELEDFINKKVV